MEAIGGAREGVDGQFQSECRRRGRGMRMGANRRSVKPTNLGQCFLSQKGKNENGR